MAYLKKFKNINLKIYPLTYYTPIQIIKEEFMLR